MTTTTITRRQVSATLAGKFQRSTNASTKVRGYGLRSVGYETQQIFDTSVFIYWHSDRFTTAEQHAAKLAEITAHLEAKGYTVQIQPNGSLRVSA